MSWDTQTPHACLPQGSTRLTACNDICMHSLCLCHGIHRRRMHASRRAAHDLLPATTYFHARHRVPGISTDTHGLGLTVSDSWSSVSMSWDPQPRAARMPPNDDFFQDVSAIIRPSLPTTTYRLSDFICACTSAEGYAPRGVPHRVQGNVDAAESPSDGLMPQSHLAPFTSLHSAAHLMISGSARPVSSDARV